MMDNSCDEFLTKIEEYLRVRPDSVRVNVCEPLSLHSTFRIGGEADLYLEPCDEEALGFLLVEARRSGVCLFVCGRGSNLLFDDRGFRGAVISTAAMRSVTVNGCCLTAAAGAALSSCARLAQENALTGMEFAAGIPGSCGGAVFMNAGAYNGEMAQIVVESRYYDRREDAYGVLRGEEHCFGYRTSVYRDHPERVILSVSMRLHPGDRAGILAKTEELARLRREKQPLEFPSAGSTFKRYPGKYTGQMIEEAGLKGFTLGGAQVSEKHAGFIINRGSAKSEDVRRLIGHIQNVIRERYGVLLEPEVIFVPENGLNG